VLYKIQPSVSATDSTQIMRRRENTLIVLLGRRW